MPKQKTKKAARRRMKITGTGKIMAFKPGKRHLNVTKSGAKIAGMGVAFELSKSDTKRVKIMFPVGER
ncbi:MAG TPA: 50S ribosomal protein L35 [Deinococcales bacterium]|nr:50S ribosomal protein L35 [Deinococcales bacterium]